MVGNGDDDLGFLSPKPTKTGDLGRFLRQEMLTTLRCQDNLTVVQENQDDITTAVADRDPAKGLAAVRALRTLADRLEDVQVANARQQGWSWQAIADVLQVSRQAVHQKHFRGE